MTSRHFFYRAGHNYLYVVTRSLLLLLLKCSAGHCRILLSCSMANCMWSWTYHVKFPPPLWKMPGNATVAAVKMRPRIAAVRRGGCGCGCVPRRGRWRVAGHRSPGSAPSVRPSAWLGQSRSAWLWLWERSKKRGNGSGGVVTPKEFHPPSPSFHLRTIWKTVTREFE